MQFVFTIETQVLFDVPNMIGICSSWDEVINILKDIRKDKQDFSIYNNLGRSNDFEIIINKVSLNQRIDNSHDDNFIVIKNHSDFSRVVSFKKFHNMAR